MTTSTFSVIDMLNKLNAHAYEYGCSCGSEYVARVVMTGKSKYSEDISLYLLLKLAHVIT